MQGGTRKLLQAALTESGMDDKEMFMVVGFEVLACSIQRSPGQKPTDISCTDTGNPTKPQEVTKGTANNFPDTIICMPL